MTNSNNIYSLVQWIGYTFDAVWSQIYFIPHQNCIQFTGPNCTDVHDIKYRLNILFLLFNDSTTSPIMIIESKKVKSFLTTIVGFHLLNQVAFFRDLNLPNNSRKKEHSISTQKKSAGGSKNLVKWKLEFSRARNWNLARSRIELDIDKWP